MGGEGGGILSESTHLIYAWVPVPLLSEFGSHTTVKAKKWPCFETPFRQMSFNAFNLLPFCSSANAGVGQAPDSISQHVLINWIKKVFLTKPST